MTGLFIREGLYVVLELLDPEPRLRSRLLRLMTSSILRNSVSNRVSVAHSSRRHSTWPCSVCRISCKYFVSRVSTRCITHLTLRNVVRERF